MSNDEAERRRGLKDWLRVLRNFRRRPLRHPLFEDADQHWRYLQERREIEAELDQEEAEAAKARRQESAAPPATKPSPKPAPEAAIPIADAEPKLRKATDEEVEAALLEVYEPLGEGNGPNVNEAVKPTQERLKLKGLKRSWDDIVAINGREKFDKFRGRIGVRRVRNPQN